MAKTEESSDKDDKRQKKSGEILHDLFCEALHSLTKEQKKQIAELDKAYSK